MTGTPWWATVLGTALGALIGGISALLVATAQTRRERRRDALETRRAAYADYLYRRNALRNYSSGVAGEIFRAIQGHGAISDERAGALVAELRTAVIEQARARTLLNLSASSQVAAEASRQSQAAVKYANELRDLINQKSGPNLVESLSAATNAEQEINNGGAERLTVLMKADLDS